MRKLFAAHIQTCQFTQKRTDTIQLENIKFLLEYQYERNQVTALPNVT